MFNGIIEDLGKIQNIQTTTGKTFTVKSKISPDLSIGESVAVNGICTTVIHNDKNSFKFYVSEQTLAITNLDFIKTKELVNLERSLALGERVSGHMMYGHVDGTLKVKEIYVAEESWLLRFDITPTERQYLIPKGSIALNGISLTIYELGKKFFKVMIIPHTYSHTNVSQFKVHDKINCEFDPMAKFIKQHTEKYLSNFNQLNK